MYNVMNDAEEIKVVKEEHQVSEEEKEFTAVDIKEAFLEEVNRLLIWYNTD